MNIQLTKREHNILLKLLTMNQKSITTKELAHLFEISIRTIKYDIDTIRFWLKQRNLTLSSQRGRGIWLDLSESQRLALKSEVLKLDKIDLPISQEKRVHKLTFELIVAEEFITSATLSEMNQVTKNTILSDLDRVEELLNQNEMIMVRENRKGFKVVGSEASKRLLMELIIQKEISEYDIYNIMSKIVKKETDMPQEKIYIGINETFQQIYDTTLSQMTKLIEPTILESINYSEILSITIRGAISVLRLLEQQSIGNYKLLSGQQSLVNKHDIPFLLVQSVNQTFELPIFEAEFAYIYSDVFSDHGNKDISKIAENIILNVGEKWTYSFHHDAALFTNLFAHLSLHLTRKHLFINEYNPFVVDIKAKYPELFFIIKEVSQTEIKNSPLIVNESFVAYLALHFLASIERIRERDVIRVIYVCSTGLGVTNLLQKKISDELTGIELVSFVSILNLQDEIIREKPDLIISIFPIENNQTPWVKVNPIPSDRDIEKIQKQVDQLLSYSDRKIKKSPIKPRKQSESAGLMEDESREIIVKGFIIFERLKDIFAEKLEEELIDSFLLHVFLMVHRIEYNAQYTNETINYQELIRQNKELVMEIEEVFSLNQLPINHAEIIALLNYLKREVSQKVDINKDAQELIFASDYQEELQDLVNYTIELMDAAEIQQTAIQQTVLINHLSEMIRRFKENEEIVAVDLNLFTEISAESLLISEKVVERLGNLPISEKYVLSIHFETAKNN